MSLEETTKKMEAFKWELMNVPEQNKPNYRLLSYELPGPRKKPSDATTTSTCLAIARTHDSETNSEDVMTVSLRHLEVPLLDKLKKFVIVGSVSGAVCFYLLSDPASFKLWNPVTGDTLDVDCALENPVAYSLYETVVDGTYSIQILVIDRIADGSSKAHLYSTATGKWSSLEWNRPSEPESFAKGPGFRCGKMIYWGITIFTGQLAALLFYNTETRLFKSDPVIAAPGYDLMSTVVEKMVEIHDVQFIICSHKVNLDAESGSSVDAESGSSVDEEVILNQLLCKETLVWTLLCTSPSASKFLDVLTLNRFLLSRDDSHLEVVNSKLDVLARISFHDNSPVTHCLLFSPNAHLTLAKEEKKKKPTTPLGLWRRIGGNDGNDQGVNDGNDKGGKGGNDRKVGGGGLAGTSKGSGGKSGGRGKSAGTGSGSKDAQSKISRSSEISFGSSFRQLLR